MSLCLFLVGCEKDDSDLANTVSGTCGSNVRWSLNTETGHLTITGTGAMNDYYTDDDTDDDTDPAPWYIYRVYLKTVEIADGVTSIGEGAFADCERLTSVTIGNSGKSIGVLAFWDCYSLTSVTIPNSVTSIGDGAFSGCDGLTSVTIGNSVKSIGEEAFLSCCGLTSVTIGNSVTTIGSSAFSGCRGLTSVTIPNSVTTIGGWAFSWCFGLTSVTVDIATPLVIDDYVFEDINMANCTLYVPAGSVERYKSAKVWKDFGQILPIGGGR